MSAQYICIGKGIKTQNFSMSELLRRGKRTPFWDYGMMMVNGVKARKALLPLQYLILRRFTPPPLQLELVRSLCNS